MSEEEGEQKPRRLRLSREAAQPNNNDTSSQLSKENTPPAEPSATEPQTERPKKRLSLQPKTAQPKVEDTPPQVSEKATTPVESTPAQEEQTPKPRLSIKPRKADGNAATPSAPPEISTQPKTPTPDVAPKGLEERNSPTPPPLASAPKSSLKPEVAPPPPLPETKAAPPPVPSKAPASTGPSSGNLDQAFERIEATPKSKSPVGSILIIFILFAIIGGGGYGIWHILTGNSTENASSEVTPSPQEAPKGNSAIERTKDVIAKRPTEALEEVLEEPTAQPKQKKTSSDTNRAEQQKVSDFLSDATYGGVRTGSNPRAVINGENYQTGDEIYEIPGLVFAGIRGDRLLFRDKNGVVYTKRF